MYWESTLDTKNKAVSNAVTRNRFGKIMKYINCYHPKEADKEDLCDKIDQSLSD